MVIKDIIVRESNKVAKYKQKTEKHAKANTAPCPSWHASAMAIAPILAL
jgi:hypothetical protein